MLMLLLLFPPLHLSLDMEKRRRERDPEEIVCGPYNPVAAPMTRDRRVRESTRRDSDPQTERGRQVTAVLEKPEHRRNRTRYLPEVTGKGVMGKHYGLSVCILF